MIKADNGAVLQEFSVQLTSCINMLRKMGYSNKIDNPDNLKKTVDRLLFSVRLKWRDTVDSIIEQEARDVTVNDIVAPKVKAARISSFLEGKGQEVLRLTNFQLTENLKILCFQTRNQNVLCVVLTIGYRAVTSIESRPLRNDKSLFEVVRSFLKYPSGSHRNNA